MLIDGLFAGVERVRAVVEVACGCWRLFGFMGCLLSSTHINSSLLIHQGLALTMVLRRGNLRLSVRAILLSRLTVGQHLGCRL